MIKKPNFFIVGAAKAGTTAMWNYLIQHPEIFLSSIKEPHFFFKEKEQIEFREDFKSRISNHKSERHQQFINSEAKYLELFKVEKEYKVIGEASASYLYSKAAPKAIFDFNPKAKILIILRNPVERAFSHYLMNLRMGFSSLPFKEDFLEDCEKKQKGWGLSHLYLELGLYEKQVKRYLEQFSSSQIYIVWNDDLKRDTQQVLNQICRFLNISSFDFNVEKSHNTAMLPRNKQLVKRLKSLNLNRYLPYSIVKPFKSIFFQSKNLPKLSASDIKTIKPYFIDDVKALEVLLNKDLSAWYNE